MILLAVISGAICGGAILVAYREVRKYGEQRLCSYQEKVEEILNNISIELENLKAIEKKDDLKTYIH